MKEKVHLIGIGGSGMLPLAMLASLQGYAVSGTDRSIQDEKAKWLENAGIKVYRTPSPSHLTDCDFAVYSTAIGPDHPEKKQAEILSGQNKIKLLHRMEFLNELVKDCRIRIGLSGTHGKTSTSSMLGFVLVELGFDPTIIVGGKPLYLSDGVRNGGGDVAVFETDESDGSFLKSNANLRICLNVDNDHLEYYGGRENLTAAFKKFVADSEISVLNGDDSDLSSVKSENCIFYHENKTPFSGKTSYAGVFQSGSDAMDVYRITGSEDLPEDHPGTVSLKIPGRHFASNALSIIALLDRACALGLLSDSECATEKIIQALNDFPGVERRIEQIGESGSVRIYDDYGHHPSEIRAVIKAFRGRIGKGRIHVIFQPHRYSRTEEHYRDFAESLSLADFVYLLPLYAAGEAPREGVSSSLIRDAMQSSCSLIGAEDFANVLEKTGPGDVLVFQGAGDISYLARDFIKKLKIS